MLKRAEVAVVEGWDTETKMREVAEGSMRCERRRIERNLRDGDKQARRKETLPTSHRALRPENVTENVTDDDIVLDVFRNA